ncbi:MAG: RagB/SusD family nutrient uptake outer membrane protein [Bacteroidales bacterium]|nr:RagB/SusD family nutrient uptake outer membrane protein [Bacteroidales bacterium]
MKKLYILILAVLGLGAVACTDLSPEIFTDVPKEDYFQTPAQFSTLIANAYSQLAGEYGYIYREGFWSLQEYTSDEVIVPTRGTDWYDGGVPQAMHQHTWGSNTRDVNNGWSFAYGGVTKCNTVIDNIYTIAGEDETQWNDAAKAGLAEAKILRAFYHLLAMDVYGNVHIDDGEREIKQYKRAEVYKWIEDELIENAALVDDGVRYGSMTRPVAYMILAKLYLNAEAYTGTPHWDKVVEYCDKIINGKYYELNADYFDNFKVSNTSNKEIIFPIVFDGVYAKGNMFHVMTMHYAMRDVFGFTTDCWNGPCTLESFYNKYSDNDKRKAQWFVGPVYDTPTTWNTIIYNRASWTGKIVEWDHGESHFQVIIDPKVTTIQDPTAANSCEGARFVKFEFDTGIAHHADSDFPIYRYADVLMMKAEALMRQNGGVATQEVLDLVNPIHTRAGLPAYTAATLTLDELLDERGREFAWEGHRRDDQIRFGTYGGKWEFKDASDKNHELFPIPDWVRDGAPGVYEQNPGY